MAPRTSYSAAAKFVVGPAKGGDWSGAMDPAPKATMRRMVTCREFGILWQEPFARAWFVSEVAPTNALSSVSAGRQGQRIRIHR